MVCHFRIYKRLSVDINQMPVLVIFIYRFRIGDIIKYAVGDNPLPARNLHNLLEPVFISYYASFKIPDSAYDADNHESYDSQCS